MESNTIKNADKEYKKGMEEITTGVFKWSKDYNAAVPHFEQAAQIYKTLKQFEKCLLSLDKAYECNQKLNDPWAVARNLESYVLIQIESIPNPKLDVMMQKTQAAGAYFQAADSYQNSITLYTQVSKYLIKNGKNQQALNLIKEGYEDSIESGQQYTRGDIFNLYVEVLVENGKYQMAIDVIEKYIKQHIDNTSILHDMMALTIICLLIICNEFIRVESKLEELLTLIPSFIKSREYKTSSQLIDFINQGNQQDFDAAMAKYPVNQIFPVNIIRILQQVKVRSNVAPVKAAPPQYNNYEEKQVQVAPPKAVQEVPQQNDNLIDLDDDDTQPPVKQNEQKNEQDDEVLQMKQEFDQGFL